MSRRRRLSLRTQIGAVVAAAVAGCTLALDLAAYELADRGGRDQFVTQSVRDTWTDFDHAAKLAAKVSPEQRPAVVAAYLRRRGVVHRMNPIPESDAEACVSDRFPPGLDHTTEPGALQHDFVTLCNGRENLAVYGAPIRGLSVSEFYDYQAVIDQQRHLRMVLLWTGLLGLTVAAVAGVLVGRRVSRPVERVAATARALGEDLSVRMPPGDRHEAREFAEVGAAFDDMAARLDTALSQQRRFVSDVAHELRTPLSAMLAASDGLSSRDPAAQSRAAELVSQQTRRLSRLVEDLLEISRFDAGQADLALEDVDLAAVARDAVSLVAPGAAIPVEPSGDPVARVDPRRVHAIVRNLVANAVQHGRPPVTVRVDGGHESEIVITVSDGGPGVPADLTDAVFDRFTRGDASRGSGPTGGATGLGLAIARENAVLHGGSLVGTPGRGEFVLRLPRRAVAR